MYNLSGIAQNTTGIASFVVGVNDQLMFGWLGNLFLMIIFVVALISFLVGTNDAGKAFIGSSFIAWVSSLLLVAAGLVDAQVMFVCLALLAGSVAINLRRS